MEAPVAIPSPGQIIRLRSRTYVVEAVDAPVADTYLTLVSAACLDDDAQGEKVEVVWGLEPDTEILNEEAWKTLGQTGFDEPRFFGAYLHTLRWNCVTATDPKLFQSPFRAGIRIDAYQLEPLRKALQLPRVNLFIADDVGLGKTIKAGLIATELLLRRRVREVVVSCPPQMLLQWKDELESRFGLVFEILDRAYLERIRQERGFGANPWNTFPRFLVSHRLLIDEAYTSPMRDWLGNLRPGSLLILDEAHHAAPASGSRYAIDSRFTRAIRDIAGRFEHRLFLSATPHNGHSNSFSSLLEILDPHRFTRGVKVVKKRLDEVMVRRLKEDIREIGGGFPKRNIIQIELSNLPPDAPELELSRLLEDYRAAREARYAGATKRKQAEAALLISGLQQRLLSSIEAFARTLKVHRKTMERIWAGDQIQAVTTAKPQALAFDWLTEVPDPDDDRTQQSEDEQDRETESAVEAATLATAGENERADILLERRLLDAMDTVANLARGQPDARVRHLIGWMQKHLCPGIHPPGQASTEPGAAWTPLRLLIFTEWEDTKRYLFQQLRLAIEGSDLADFRIEVFHGPTPPDKREAIKRAFNQPPEEHPLRILIATDSAREGLNLQAHCSHLFHFDVPWNPARLEQRNGRIDRKLQPSAEVFCHYYVYTQRPEDRVLQALIRKTDIIRRELGSLAPVISARLAAVLKGGINRGRADRLAAEIAGLSLESEQRSTVEEELEAARERQDALRKQIDRLRVRINDARSWIGLDHDHFREALSCSLELLGAEPLKRIATPPGHPERFEFPSLGARRGADPSWAGTLDTLRALPTDGRRSYDWRRTSPIRPVVFSPPEGIDDGIVQLHLEHRVVQRLLGRFLSQGFVHHDLSRACLAQSEDAIPRVVMLGRLSLYGKGAVRLHEELLTVTARWVASKRRQGGLTLYGRDTEARTLELLEKALLSQPSGDHVPQTVRDTLQASLADDIGQLLGPLETRGQVARAEAEARLTERGRLESAALHGILEDQRQRVAEALGKPIQMMLDFGDADTAELRQAESNRRYWERWLQGVENDLQREPARIQDFYQVTSAWVEPVGIAYLWPITG